MTVISGGQTGVDIGALKAAQAAALKTGGWMPRGWLTEDGPHPEYAELYRMLECPIGGYPARTEMNIGNADATLILAGDVLSPGTRLTVQSCRKVGKPFEIFDPTFVTVQDVLQWLPAVEVLNVAGNRESKSPGIEAWTVRFLGEVFAAVTGRK